MRLFVNGLGANTSSGLTYIRNVLPELSQRRGLHTLVAVNNFLRAELHDLPNVSFVELDVPRSSAARFCMEQVSLPSVIERSRADVLLSTGNFALWRSPVPEILLSGNSLYTSSTFVQDLLRRRAYGLWLDTKIKGFLARRSIHWADCTIAPSQSFAEELSRWSGAKVVAIYHGFDSSAFFSSVEPLSEEVQRKLDFRSGTWRLLFVSHYNYFRNFETLFRALPILKSRLGGKRVKLFLTCTLGRGQDESSYRSSAAASFVKRLGISDDVVELGPIPYCAIHHVYRACDVYVSPAYTETFAHPLVEAMASGLPVVASDISVHQEICGAAALHFPTFSAERLAEQVYCLYTDAELRGRLSRAALARACDFSWKKHVDELLGMAEDLRGKNANRR